MIDLHGHYLPGVDDGAKDNETSVAMLRHAKNDGIKTLVATPHAGSALCAYRDLDVLRRSWKAWRSRLEGENLGVTIVSGAEVFFTSEIIPQLKDNRDVLTINNGSYFLLEFPHDYVYAHSRDFVYNILNEGFIPVISHAERNSEIQRSPGILRDLVETGALCQVNGGSLRGDFGNAARECAFGLLHDNLVHVIASDAHDLEKRAPELSYVPALLPMIDKEKIELLLDGIPQAIIADEGIPDIGEPGGRRSGRKLFGFFGKKGS